MSTRRISSWLIPLTLGLFVVGTTSGCIIRSRGHGHGQSRAHSHSGTHRHHHCHERGGKHRKKVCHNHPHRSTHH